MDIVYVRDLILNARIGIYEWEKRIVQKILGLGSIKEAILFPRDVKRLMP